MALPAPSLQGSSPEGIRGLGPTGAGPNARSTARIESGLGKRGWPTRSGLPESTAGLSPPGKARPGRPRGPDLVHEIADIWLIGIET